jgi:hypothetical protein
MAEAPLPARSGTRAVTSAAFTSAALSSLASPLRFVPSADGWTEYATDAFQRSILFLDVLRRRGNEQEQIASHPLGTVLRFEHASVMSGRSLPKPINFSLARIIPPPGTKIDPRSRPIVVVDPRAGQGPGIGGFKASSEIGDALAAGHPVYFIGFAAKPVPGQEFLDIVEGQIKFFERVRELHPEAPLPVAIGNCQAGYQTLMVAMLRPDLFGPCMVAGSPMSYWQGVRGKNPMRYSGGLLGGSWLTALISDLGNGIFDGTWLILNFDNLNPSNWLWGKQYQVYANVDEEADRYLTFERWWGDFVQLNGGEMQFLVDQLFIGDKLTRNAIRSSDDKTFDVRNITSPLVVLTSMGDNISPPQQTLGWLLDLYRDVDEMRACGRTAVYCIDPKVGHLAIFVSAKVGAKEDEEIVKLIEVIECLPPGLYELVIESRQDDAAESGFTTGAWTSRLVPRTFDDIRALGRNSEADDRAFATVARLSELNLSAYRTFWQPFMRGMANGPAADMARQLNPLRLSYTMFADSNPWMKAVGTLAESVRADRRPVSPANPFLALQNAMSDQIGRMLDAYRELRDRMVEQMFFSIVGSPVVQGMLGIDTGGEVRSLPGVTPAELAEREARVKAADAKLAQGGLDEALVRATLFVTSAEKAVDERSMAALNATRKRLSHLAPADYQRLARNQLAALLADCDRAIGALQALVATPEERAEILQFVCSIVGAGRTPTPSESERLARLEKALAVKAEELAEITAKLIAKPERPRAASVR